MRTHRNKNYMTRLTVEEVIEKRQNELGLAFSGNGFDSPILRQGVAIGGLGKEEGEAARWFTESAWAGRLGGAGNSSSGWATMVLCALEETNERERLRRER